MWYRHALSITVNVGAAIIAQTTAPVPFSAALTSDTYKSVKNQGIDKVIFFLESCLNPINLSLGISQVSKGPPPTILCRSQLLLMKSAQHLSALLFVHGWNTDQLFSSSHSNLFLLGLLLFLVHEIRYF